MDHGAGDLAWNTVLMEPQLEALLDAKRARRDSGPYSSPPDTEVNARLEKLVAAELSNQWRIEKLERMAGGASKEQFSFYLVDPAGSAERLVLRMDPKEGVLESSRLRESQVQSALHGVVPVPKVRFLDPDGRFLGHPAMVTEFVSGVTKPSAGEAGVSGLGTGFGSRLKALISPQFIENMVKIHSFDPVGADLSAFSVPTGDPRLAALWQINFWSRVRRDDAVDAVPIFALTEAWLRNNIPLCERPVLLHGDFRTGNFLFSEDSGEITAILDWELAHFGDFHQDLAWNLQPFYGSKGADGEMLIGGLFSREEFIDRYERASGRTVDPRTLHYYDVMTSYKLSVMVLTSGIRAARDGTNHQDALLTLLAPVGHIINARLADLLAENGA